MSRALVVTVIVFAMMLSYSAVSQQRAAEPHRKSDVPIHVNKRAKASL